MPHQARVEHGRQPLSPPSVSFEQLKTAAGLRSLADQSHAFYRLLSPIIHANEKSKRPVNWTRPDVPATCVQRLLDAVQHALRTPSDAAPSDTQLLGPDAAQVRRASELRTQLSRMGSKGSSFLLALDQVAIGPAGRPAPGSWAEKVRRIDVEAVIDAIDTLRPHVWCP